MPETKTNKERLKEITDGIDIIPVEKMEDVLKQALVR